MRKIKELNIKVDGVILLFSFVVTAAFIVLLSLFSGVFSHYNGQMPFSIPNTTIYAVSLNDENAKQLFADGSYMLSPEKVVPISDYNKIYFEYLIQRIIPYAILFFVFLFTMTVILWVLLKRIQEKNNLQIVKQLNNIADTNTFSSDNPALIRAYNNIKQKFEDNLSDYKRLNSYLSHEQKNAISILRTRMELSEDTRYLQNIDAISQSIDDLLTLSEANDTAVTVPVDVALICAAVCDSYKTIQNNITFTFDENENTEITAKERWIYRAVANLVSNAIKYGNGKEIEVNVRNKKHSVIVTVKDHGIGIAPENQEKIFNHRYRINELKKDGYGIGLSLVSHVCDLCGGFATLESSENMGSTFYLSFPEKTC